MKLKVLCHTLVLAVLVFVAGCSAPPSDSGAVIHPVKQENAAATKPPEGDRPATGAVAPRQLPEPPRVRLQSADTAQTAPPAPAPRNSSKVDASTGYSKVVSEVRPAPSVVQAPRFVQGRPAAINTENYTHRDTNPVHLASEEPVSTFSIDVDTGSYTNVRSLLEAGQMPPADAVRAEEFINYFDYDYPLPTGLAQPFGVTTELAPAPWNAERQLLLVGIQGYRVPAREIPASNLVFLIDTSGSMGSTDKLPLLKTSLKQLVQALRPQDRLAIVTYAGSAGIALASTAGDQHAIISAAIDSLGARGSTNGGAGIELAYAQARQGFISGGVNRVILATDGDFNVGTVNLEALKTIVERNRKSGVALTTFGFGRGNYNDAMAVTLADAGNGSHHYIDSVAEGRRVLVDEMSATLLTIAKDVKIQIEFNPEQVQEYRLIGYEKRMLKREDFNNDQVDAGDIGAGANVTAIYEITRTGSSRARIDPLRYGRRVEPRRTHQELAFLRLRYKRPGQSNSQLVELPLSAVAVAQPSERLRFATAVAAFADALRGGKYLDGYSFAKIAALASGARGKDDKGYRAGFVQLVRLAEGLSPSGKPQTAAANGQVITPRCGTVAPPDEWEAHFQELVKQRAKALEGFGKQQQ